MRNTVTLTCGDCARKFTRLRVVGARPKRCPECRRPKVRVRDTLLAMPPVVLPKPTPFVALGPCRCQGCGEPLWWAKRNSRRLGVNVPKIAWREEGGTLHRCPEWQIALLRARAKWDNTGVGSSDETNRIANGARVSATTRGAGVVASIEVVAR